MDCRERIQGGCAHQQCRLAGFQQVGEYSGGQDGPYHRCALPCHCPSLQTLRLADEGEGRGSFQAEDRRGNRSRSQAGQPQGQKGRKTQERGVRKNPYYVVAGGISAISYHIHLFGHQGLLKGFRHCNMGGTEGLGHIGDYGLPISSGHSAHRSQAITAQTRS